MRVKTAAPRLPVRSACQVAALLDPAGPPDVDDRLTLESALPHESPRVWWRI